MRIISRDGQSSCPCVEASKSVQCHGAYIYYGVHTHIFFLRHLNQILQLSKIWPLHSSVMWQCWPWSKCCTAFLKCCRPWGVNLSAPLLQRALRVSSFLSFVSSHTKHHLAVTLLVPTVLCLWHDYILVVPHFPSLVTSKLFLIAKPNQVDGAILDSKQALAGLSFLSERQSVMVKDRLILRGEAGFVCGSIYVQLSMSSSVA